VIKAVFFDWFNTLAHYEPPREELHSKALQDFGIHIPPDKILPALLIADKEFFKENTISPIRKRSPEEQAKLYTRYQASILTEAGVDVSQEPDMVMKVMKKVRELAKGMHFVLFDDALSTIQSLKEQSLILGLLTNLDRDVDSICRGLGLEPYLDFIVTSGQVDADKPQPPIFLAALEKAGVDASQAIHIGDQYIIDVVGARGVGINPILLDRYNSSPEITDCPRITSLTELTAYLQ